MSAQQTLWRQGDILIQTCDKLPEKEHLKRKKGTVLVHGEASGHTHSLANRRTGRIFESLIEREKALGTLYLEIFVEKADIVHPEHGTISLNQGVYRVWRQREYALNGTYRTVYD